MQEKGRGMRLNGRGFAVEAAWWAREVNSVPGEAGATDCASQGSTGDTDRPSLPQDMQSDAGMTQPRAGFQCCLPIRDSSCENDLEELMRQIDIMVNSKKVEWEQQVVTLQQRLQAQDKELSDTRNALDKKKCEIQLLWKKLEESDQAENEKVEKYEKQLQALRYQLCKLKKSYEKLSFYSSKNQSDKNGELCPEDKASQCELQWLTHRLEEFKVLSNEWENQRTFYKNQLKSLCDQRKSLTEKCQLLQEQSQSYQEQLSSRTQLQDEAVANNQAEIRRLRCQLDVSQETIRSDRVIIDNLNSTIKEITLSRNSLKDENQQLLEELNRCQKRCQKMELDLSEVRAALQAHNHLLESSELDQKPVQIAGPDVKLNKKPHGNDTSIQERCEPWTYKAQSQDLAMKRFGLCKPLHDQIENDQEEKAESNDLERLRTDITDPTTKLHQRDIPTAMTSDKRFHLEQDLELQKHNNGIQQALKSPKELREDSATDSGILHPEFERLNERHIKPHAEQEMKEQLPGKMKVSQRLRAKAATQINGEQERSFVEKSNYKATTQTAHSSNGNPTFQSEWEVNHCDWDSPSRSLRINLDTLQAINSLQNGDHSWDFMDFSPPFFWDQQKDTFTSSSTGTSFISAAEKFLNEENKRAQDFEDVLNLHIEEMQRYSENTLAKYRILYQSRHI